MTMHHCPPQKKSVFSQISVAVMSTSPNDTATTHFQSQLESLPKPLDRVPCALVVPSDRINCAKSAKIFCESCRLVSYCSEDCQRLHWPAHKLDCKSDLLSASWTPSWMLENREPIFETSSGHTTSPSAYFNCSEDEPLFTGLYLWGNSPAMDMMNATMNEGAEAISKQDLNLALIASGDLRHLVQTVNSLPDDFSGSIDFLVNDREEFIVARNMALILLLADGIVNDADPLNSTLVAEAALHLWASVHVPTAVDSRLAAVTSQFLRAVEATSKPTNDRGETEVDVKIGETLIIKGLLPEATLACLREWERDEGLDAQEVAEELAHARRAVNGEDRHHSHYLKLEPSHRVAIEEFRRSGIVLPFGASKVAFNAPNRTLFSPSGKWVQDDLANPLDSWDIEAVIEAGKRNGTTREDLYGCLYFFLSQTFSTFVRRLRQIPFTFRFFSMDIQDLAQRIIHNQLPDASRALPPASHHFDRIHGSNVIDDNLAGIAGVVENWGPLLKENNFACIMSYFMSWGVTQKGATWESADPEKRVEILKRYIDEGKTPKLRPDVSLSKVDQPGGVLASYLTSLTAATENSSSFEEYLGEQRLEEALKNSGLQRRIPHKIVPYRLGVPVGEESSISSLPKVLEDKERYYLNTCVTQWMWSERFIEFCH